MTSCMSEAADPICAEIAGFLSKELAIPVVFVQDIPWQERMQQLDAGRIQIGWICGLPYVQKVDQARPDIEILAAPVMTDPRYLGKPIYYSDVIVRQKSQFQSFADLRGRVWAYNEVNSYSGHIIVLNFLDQIGETLAFFREIKPSGAHSASLKLVLEGKADAAAIDSTALDQILSENPKIKSQIRILKTLGPSPIPPWINSRLLGRSLRQQIQDILLTMHQSQSGNQILARGKLSRFIAVQDQDYHTIRQNFRAVERQLS